MTRKPEPVALARGTALAVLAGAALACAPPPAGPALAIPEATGAVEARFGASYCRRIEDREQLGELVAFAASVRTGWQAAWNEPPPPQLVIDFYQGDARVLRLGVGDGQLFTTLEERAFFQPLDAARADDLIRRLGGPPTDAPAVPCRFASGG
jgi:hypothetical protein